jgi:hypothetical protein
MLGFFSEETMTNRNYFSKKFKRPGITVYDPGEPPFRIYGLMYSAGRRQYHRFPYELTDPINDNLRKLNTHTSGGRIRFSTDSSLIALRCRMNTRTVFSHMPQTGTGGFTVYADDTYYNTFIPPLPVPGTADKGYAGIMDFPDKKKRDITIYFPLYNEVNELSLGLEEKACLESAKDYKYQSPIIFYGSSITQGGCASCPGNSYDAIVCRNLNADYINAGFSGNCKAELSLADYFATVNASVFVYDYDHNAPDPAFLKKTHYPFYQRYRRKNKTTPVVMISRPDFTDKPNCRTGEQILRREIIRGSYEKGIAAGDRNLYFIDGETLFGKKNTRCCTVDTTHPNDIGFMRMAQKVTPLLRQILAG